MKSKLAKLAASVVLKNSLIEKGFCYFCSQPNLRKSLKLGAIALGCVQVLSYPEIRLANFKKYKMYVNIAEPLGIAAYFFQENRTIWLTSDLIQEGDICIDAGANMGHYTLLMASKVGLTGKVISFEPQPKYFEMISKSIKLNNYNSFAFVDNRALWKLSGEKLKFYISENPNNSGTSSLVNHGLYLNEDNSIDVVTITLSDYLQQANISKIRLIKIDVERTEVEVLEGMYGLLEANNIDFIILEMYSHSKAQEILIDFGYSCFGIDSEKRRIINIHNIEKGEFGDYLFVNPKCLPEFMEVYGQNLSE
jgi:FkbM family methyltransferase